MTMFKVVFERTHNAIYSDIDYLLITQKGIKPSEAENIKSEFVNNLIGETANAITVADIANKHFKIHPDHTHNNVLRTTDVIKSRFELDGREQALKVWLDYNLIRR